jgi:hypothetical protein
MALVTNMEKRVKDKHTIHKKTECSYYIVQAKDGQKYLQLDTIGSDERQITGKVSQSIQFTPEALSQLKEILLKEF